MQSISTKLKEETAIFWGGECDHIPWFSFYFSQENCPGSMNRAYNPRYGLYSTLQADKVAATNGSYCRV